MQAGRRACEARGVSESEEGWGKTTYEVLDGCKGGNECLDVNVEVVGDASSAVDGLEDPSVQSDARSHAASDARDFGGHDRGRDEEDRSCRVTGHLLNEGEVAGPVYKL